MAIIHMDTDSANHTASVMYAALSKLYASSRALSNQVNRLPNVWYGGSSDKFVEKANTRLNKISYLMDQLDALRSTFQREIDQWIAADREGPINLRIPPGMGRTGVMPFIPPEAIIRDVDASAVDFFEHCIWDEDFLADYPEYTLEDLDLSYEELLMISTMYESGDLPANSDLQDVLDAVDNIKVTIWEKNLGAAQVAVAAGSAGTESLGVDYAILAAEARADAFFEKSDGVYKAGVEGEAGVYLAKVSGSAGMDIPLGPATAAMAVAGTAYVGAEAVGSAAFVFDPKNGQVGAELGGEVFAGGKIEGEAEAGLGIGGVEAKVKGKASLNYGIGVTGKADFGFDQGTFKADIELGATLGLGFDVSISPEIDVSGAVEHVNAIADFAAGFL